MNFFQFIDAKLLLHDIDPLYYAIWNANLDSSTRARLTLAQSCFDHAGPAALAAETAGKGFWAALGRAGAYNVRGGSRRHFWAERLDIFSKFMQSNYKTAEAAVDILRGDFHYAEATALQWPGVGRWAAFKLCDMAERVCCAPIDYSRVTIKSLISSSQIRKGVDVACSILDCTEEDFYAQLYKRTWPLASPRFDRPVALQEWETALCNYSHAHKHMPGEDTVQIRQELNGWGALAGKIARALPGGSK